MRHRVRRLRLYGVPSEPQDWHFGYVQMARGKLLQLSKLGSSPGMGVMDQLFQPRVICWTRDVVRVMGVEPVLTDRGVASYVQEWEIQLNSMESDDGRPWTAPGLFEWK